MNGTYLWISGNTPFFGWLYIGIAAIFGVFSFKRRQFVGPMVCCLVGIFHLVAKPDDTFATFYAIPLFLGLAIDAGLTLRRTSAKRSRYLILLIYAVYPSIPLVFTSSGRALVLTDITLTERPANSVVRRWPDTNISKNELTATLIHVADANSDDWRFSSASNPTVGIFIFGDYLYKDDLDRTYTGEEMARQIVKWAGVKVIEKTVPSPNPNGD